MKANEHLREEQVIPYLDGRLPASEQAAVEEHLESCLKCRTQVAELHRLLEVLAEWAAVEPSASFAAGLQRRLEAERAEQPVSWWVRLQVRPIYAGALGVVLVAAALITLWPPSQPEPAKPAQVASLEAEVVGEEDLATLEPVVLENYELLREFDILFEAQPAKEEKKL